VLDVALHRPTLDDVFLSLTGHAAEQETGDKKKGRGRGRRGKTGAEGGAA
jgi:ABC-2 type transport system ATP-binding protein